MSHTEAEKDEARKIRKSATAIAVMLNELSATSDVPTVMMGVTLYLTAITVEKGKSKEDLLEVLDKTFSIEFPELQAKYKLLEGMFNALSSTGGSQRRPN